MSASEDFECKLFVQWLDSHGYLFSHLAQSTFVGGINRFATLARNKALGVRKGVPDYLIVLKSGAHRFLEMKKSKGGTESPEQKQWRSALRSAICRGHQEAIAQVIAWENET